MVRVRVDHPATNNLFSVNPSLARQWHPTKNGQLTPRDVTPHSSRRVWWICAKGHEWQATIARRSDRTGCPYCAGHAVCEDNCLATLNPSLARQWHPTRNGQLTPKDVTQYSYKKVWWICSKGHEWQARICNRSRGAGCPYCIGKAVCDDNCLATLNPELAQQWYPPKNGQLTPKDVPPHSSKKVWWLCPNGHVWRASVDRRSRGVGCPYCAGQAVCDDNCLATLNPSLARQWHPTKNGQLTPNDVTANSRKKVWWLCPNGHVWRASVDRRSRGVGCPYCAGQAVCDDNCLATLNPSLARQWHPTKNGQLTPNDVTANSRKKVWWLCPEGHEWQSLITSRNYGSGCPYCTRKPRK
ncbi:MAG: zinc-ribbon domain-containing protein [Dehalococcoidales bacterium]|nr:zinc-ribbon domain-containing protein [Dehalococcoidales bacterium]